jgi:hypothetical protein
MKQQRFVPPRSGASESVPFQSAEEAWFWGVKGVKCRLEGAQMRPVLSAVERPCEAVDVVNCAAGLQRAHRLSHQQIAILFLYGGYNVPPRALGEKHARAAEIWDEALTILAQKLEQKGIINIAIAKEQRHA